MYKATELRSAKAKLVEALQHIRNALGDSDVTTEYERDSRSYYEREVGMLLLEIEVDITYVLHPAV